LNLRHGWVVIKTATGATPGVTLVWRDGKRHVTDPSALAGQLKALVAAGLGKS
jgi:hypothetical protein